MNKSLTAKFKALMKGALAPDPTTGENEEDRDFGEGGSKGKKKGKPYNEAIDQGTVSQGRVEPQRPGPSGTGSNGITYNDTQPHRYGDNASNNTQGNEQWRSLGKSVVHTPWGAQEATLEQYLPQPELGKALVLNPLTGQQAWTPVQIHQAASQPVQKSLPSGFQSLRKGMGADCDDDDKPRGIKKGGHPDEDEDKKLFEEMFADKMKKGEIQPFQQNQQQAPSLGVLGIPTQQSLLRGVTHVNNMSDREMAKSFQQGVTVPVGSQDYGYDPARDLLASRSVMPQQFQPSFPQEQFQQPQQQANPYNQSAGDTFDLYDRASNGQYHDPSNPTDASAGAGPQQQNLLQQRMNEYASEHGGGGQGDLTGIPSFNF